jgi:hypothetical protein
VFLGLIGASTARATATFGWFAYQPLADSDFAFVAGSWRGPRGSMPFGEAGRAMSDTGILGGHTTEFEFHGAATRRAAEPGLDDPVAVEDEGRRRLQHRFAASVTAVLLLVDVFLGLIGASTARATATFGWLCRAW